MSKRKKPTAKSQSKAFYLQQLLKEIRSIRENKHATASEHAQLQAHGMIAAGLFLDQLTSAEYSILWDLASNAWGCRWFEFHHKLPLYSRQPATSPVLEAAA
ncbi:hypothetical protein [Pseudomonas sp.]|uniref:hypothetical protein n=1 Tax=Pseudomonas sp. TaxID=306 RepID=UPI00272EF7DD|nr:hypothetical protein [Pseudomonas sp.]MDP2447637.1 hypothetical protein [Pseudomonas sp.]MDZ4334297.1 hypothetical protein [Pseudomonas sp.]